MGVYYEKRSAPYSVWESKNLSFPSHIHQDIELVYLLDGTIQVTIGRTSRILTAGEMAVIFPHTAHTYISGEKGSQSYVCIFSTLLVRRFIHVLETQRPEIPFLTKEKIHPDILYVINRLLESRTIATPDHILQSYFSLLFGRILEHLNLEKNCADSGTLSQGIAFVENHACEPLTLNEIAEAVGVSKYHLSHIFGQKLGTTLHQYLNSVRIQRALGMLQEGIPASEACYACGFESSSTFYRVFHEQIGMSPGVYQNMLHSPNRKKSENS